MDNQQVYTTIVRLNAQEAENNLHKLREKVEQLKEAKDKALKGSDEHKMLAKELKSAEAELKSYENSVKRTIDIINDLANSSAKEIEGAMKALKREQKNATSPEEWAQMQQHIEACQAELERMKHSVADSKAETERLAEATANLDKVMGDIEAASINELCQAQKRLNELMADMNPLSSEYKRLEAQAMGVKTRLDQLNNSQKQTNSLIDQYDREMEKVNKDLVTQGRETMLVDDTIKKLSSATLVDLQYSLKIVQESMRHMERDSDAFKEMEDKAEKLKEAIAEVNGELKESRSLFSRFIDGLNKNWGAITQILGAVTGLSMTIRNTVKDYASIEAEMANVRKFTGMTAEQVATLNEELKEIDTRSSRIELNKLAEEAGKLGMQSQKNVLEFVRAADQINVALDELGEGATLTISKLTDIFGDAKEMGVEKSMLAVGSVINELSQNCTASAGYMAEFGKRMAGVGAQANMTIPQIMAFASVLDSQGQAVEMSATALSQLIMKLFKDPAKIAKAAGLQVTEFTNLLKKDANEALLVLLQRLHEFSADDGLAVIAPIFKDMGADGARASGVLAALAKNIDMVRKQQVEANKAFKDGTSVTKEFEVQNNTVEAGLEKAKKQFFEVSAALGQKLEPIAKYTVNTFSMMVKTLNVIIEVLFEYKDVIVTATAAIVAYTAVVKAEIAITKAYTLATKVATMIQHGFNAAVKANPVGLFVSVLVAAAVALRSFALRSQGAKKRAEEAAKANKEYQKSLTDITQASHENARQELTDLDALYKAAINEASSKQERIKAARQLQETYPEYFRNMSAEDIALGKAKSKYEELTKAIVMHAKAKAAAAKIEENEAKILELEDELERRKSVLEEKTAKRDELAEKPGANKSLGGYAGNPADKAKKANEEVEKAMQDVTETSNAIRQIAHINAELAEKYSVSQVKVEELTKNTTVTETPRGLSDEELRKQEKARKDADERERAALELQLTNLALLYSQGEKDYYEYQEEIYEAQKASLEKRQKIWGKETLEYAKIAKELQDLEDSRTARYNAEDLKTLESEHQMKLAYIKSSTDEEGNVKIRTEEETNEAIFQENMEYLRRKQSLYKQYSKEWYDIDVQICETLEKEKFRKQEAHQRMLEQFRKQWGEKDIETQKQITLRGLEEIHKAGLISEEEYQKASLAIKAQYAEKAHNQEIEQKKKTIDDIIKIAKSAVSEEDEAKSNISGAGIGGDILGIIGTISCYKTMYEQIEQMREDDLISEEEAAEAKKRIGGEAMNGIIQKVQAAYNEINAIVNAAAAYSAACSQYEVAKITADYDKQIEAAGNNSKKKEKLEKERDEKIKKAKTAANKKAMKIEIAQALASTAMAAINAYASAAAVPVVGYILGPIAAAAALAAGALQIATIKKQHKTEELGYYEGGFTDGRNYKKKAGVVHEGEFVANHLAVNNPTVRPALELLDQAQKNNTIGKLDFPQAMGYGNTAAVVAPIVNVQSNNDNLNDAITQMNEAVANLNSQLAAGIRSITVIDGPDGVKHQLDVFNKLNDNA